MLTKEQLFEMQKIVMLADEIRGSAGVLRLPEDSAFRQKFYNFVVRELRKVMAAEEQLDSDLWTGTIRVSQSCEALAVKEQQTVGHQIKSMKDDVNSMLKKLDDSGVLTNQNTGDSLDGEDVLDNPRPSGDKVATTKNVPTAQRRQKNETTKE